MAKGKKIYTGIGLDERVLAEVDRRRREKSLKEGKDISRSAFINTLIIKALEKEGQLA